jgi:nicotinamide-nucleotide amidase
VVTDEELRKLAERVGRALLAARCRFVTAESCTAGWIAKALTDVAGSSDWYECGYVPYSNQAKVRDLGVAAVTHAVHGAVSEAAVREMSEGALQRAGAQVALAVSGIAGPSGAVPGKPVGTVWFALANRMEERLECQGHLIQFEGNRDAVRRQAVEYALNLLRSLLLQPA